MSEASFISATEDGVLLSIKLQPRASRNEIVAQAGRELRIRVTAPPVDSAANEALIKLLSKELGLARNRIQLVRGKTSRHKVVKLQGLTADEVRVRLPAL